MNFVRKTLLVLIPLVVMSYFACSQDTSSTRIPNVNLRAAVKLIESLRIDSILMARDIRLLRERITARDAAIYDRDARIRTYEDLKANYQSIITNLREQVKVNYTVVTGLQKEVRKANTAKWLIGAGGVAAMLLTGYLTTR